VRTIVKETQRAATTSGIIDDLGYHRTVVFEKKLIANTNLTGWFYKHIPQAEIGIQLAQEEHLDLGIRLLLCAIKTSGEHLGIIEDKGVVFIKIVEKVFKQKIGLDAATLSMGYHQTTLIAMVIGRHGDLILRKFKFKL
jgi:uncharacterized membrane protein YkgB